MIVAIHQPHYLPYLGYFDKIDRADVFVFLDQVQFSRQNFQHRNRIKTPGGLTWLTVPIAHTGAVEHLIDLQIVNDTPWIQRHWKMLELGYADAPFFAELKQTLLPMYGRPFANLAELNIALVTTLADIMGIRARYVRSSELALPALKKNALLAEICRRLGADVYLSGDGAKTYLDPIPFDDNRVAVRWQHFQHPPYTQRWMQQGFVPNLTVLDVLANLGPRAADLMRNSRALSGSSTNGQAGLHEASTEAHVPDFAG